MNSPEVPFDSASFLKHVTSAPGVYRMLNAAGEILYVGKAGNLKKRLSSYFRNKNLNPKTSVMLRHMAGVEVTVTHTETEALLLENNIIKQHRPRYNVVLRDDKSYPYIYINTQDVFPRLTVYRGRRQEHGRYFGPYPSAHAARETVNLLQKLFLLRQCNDAFFRNRSRPCLQFQIKHCSAPCVRLIEQEDYARDVQHAVMFLEGRSREVIDAVVKRMERASHSQDYELAARYRDQISSLRNTVGHQHISANRGDFDLIAAEQHAGVYCIAVMMVRGGRNLGCRTFYPRVALETTLAELLAAFLPQHYLGRDVPGEILLAAAVPGMELLQSALSEQSGRRVRIRRPQRGAGKHMLALAKANAAQALHLRLAMDAGSRTRLESLQEALQLEQPPQRLECFDISHTMGEGTVASCVVFNSEGPIKSQYRRFNIEGLSPGDDYGAISQALTRRYTRLKKGEGIVPDVLFIDGGKGQLHAAEQALEELQVQEVMLVGVAKGRSRKPGMEQLFLSARKTPLILPADSPALHLIQQIRDEAHRFAITGHRQRRARARNTSLLESVPGLGSKRRQQLLKQFGGLQQIARAGVEDLASVHGISHELAGRIYDLLHGD
ncbi:MAG: excinuclease ABC subunit UvrC [Gammaproteobacteria bacterium]|nr:excinuclease ABC subunit UvrC [Gammaproteobacteria bacterium]